MKTKLRRLYLAAASVLVTSCLVIGGWLYLRSRKPPHNFLVDEAHYYVADPIAGHLHRPHAKFQFPWPEHPKGEITFLTNNLGFREDNDTAIKKAEHTVRILVTGDSHTDGVVYNAESFPNLMEEKLNARPGVPRFEVINGGVGYYTFQNYAGFLRKYLELRPDYFVVTVYLGNDFMEAIQFAIKRGEIAQQSRSIWYRMKLWRAPGPLISQAGNQLVFFEAYPEMKAKALEIARAQMKEIQQTCQQHNIQLVVVLLSTKVDVEEKARHDAASSLRLTEAQLDLNQALKRSLIESLAQDGVSYLDMTDVMKGKNYDLFWNQDYHLNDKGHRLVADALFDQIQAGSAMKQSGRR